MLGHLYRTYVAMTLQHVCLYKSFNQHLSELWKMQVQNLNANMHKFNQTDMHRTQPWAWILIIHETPMYFYVRSKTQERGDFPTRLWLSSSLREPVVGHSRVLTSTMGKCCWTAKMKRLCVTMCWRQHVATRTRPNLILSEQCWQCAEKQSITKPMRVYAHQRLPSIKGMRNRNTMYIENLCVLQH